MRAVSYSAKITEPDLDPPEPLFEAASKQPIFSKMNIDPQDASLCVR